MMISAVRALFACALLLSAAVAAACANDPEVASRIVEVAVSEERAVPVEVERLVEAGMERVVEVETETAPDQPAADRAVQESDLGDDDFRQTPLTSGCSGSGIGRCITLGAVPGGAPSDSG